MTVDSALVDQVAAVRTVDDLAAALRRLRAKAGNPSLRALQQWANNHHRSLPRTTVADMLRGHRLPRLPLLLDFLSACGVPNEQTTVWADAWTRLVEPGADEARLRGHESTGTRPAVREPAGWERDARALLELMRNGWRWTPPPGPWSGSATGDSSARD